ncbi:BZIP transcription factor, variant [Blastomyces dermatitidis ATCC 18188]|uniref:BZIP transcription factor n=1 Tax=Ajellomyces dermatitidis (strain ATCC 18188 / CBS 674.68) TaxID=653446 RepID=F2TP23_AJEDA|nr:BZIP transcription factor [Blastomyces dermatitidis ATCC 18188]KMW68500.1 BZIP transcription factor, variant [Blastomyces dermatitidis ATCC 18188]
MDYTYYQPPFQQQYSPYQIPHPQQTEVAQQSQFHQRPGGDHYDPRFQPFDTQLHFDSSTLMGVHSLPSPGHYGKHVTDSQVSDGGGIARITLENGMEDFPSDKTLPRGSSEEKETLTPAQSRRKEQNRAAQRAFRERKERRVRDLEQELNQYKSNYSSLMEDHRSLKRQIEKVATENEILRATSNSNAQGSIADYGPNRVPTPTGLLRNLSDYSSCSGNKKELASRTLSGNGKSGQKLLDASATWDLIVRHLSSRGVKLDIQDIYDRLKSHTLPDGKGLVVDEAHVLQVIEESAAAGSDELI